MSTNASENSSYSKEFPCLACDKVLKSKLSHTIHMRIHTGDKPFVCAYCDKAFADGSTFKKHERIHTGERPYLCSICKKSFNQKVLLHNHLKVIHAELKTMLNCQINLNASEDSKSLECDEKLYSKTSAMGHMKTHQQEEVLCNTCGLKITVKQEFINQQKMSTNATGNSSHSKEFPCLICDKVLKSKLSQKIHMRIHTGERPFVCAYCYKAFIDGSSLRKHERIHTGEKPYACPVCPRAFNQKVGLREHIQNNHVKSNPNPEFKVNCYRCEVCNNLFLSSSKFCAHLVQHSDENRAKARNIPARTRCENIGNQKETMKSETEAVQSSSTDCDNFPRCLSNVTGVNSMFAVQTHKIDNSKLVKNLQKSSKQVTTGSKSAIPEPMSLTKEQNFEINNGQDIKPYLTALDSDNPNRLEDQVSLENTGLIQIKIEPNDDNSNIMFVNQGEVDHYLQNFCKCFK